MNENQTEAGVAARSLGPHQAFTLIEQLVVIAIIVMARHGNGINLATFHGSMRLRRMRELWPLAWHSQFDTTYGSRQGTACSPAWML
jgi:prepilin-type N-terminal cleavage/methylation domain-containing protein